MSNTFKAISLSTINASGCSHKALASALTTDMFFGQKSPLEIRVDKGIAQPFFTVPLPEIESLDVITKKQLLLTECLQETAKQLAALSSVMPISTIEQLIIVTSMFMMTDDEQRSATENDFELDAIEKNKQAWQQLVAGFINDYLTDFSNKLAFKYVHQPSIDQQLMQITQANNFERPVLIINIDSLVDYNNVALLNKMTEVQCLQGTAGIMPAEGASSTLLIPNGYPDIAHKQLITIEPLNTEQQQNIKAQLTQAKFSLPNTVLHVGTISDAWVTHWYGQTNSFYRQIDINEQADSSNSADQGGAVMVAEAKPAQASTAKILTLYDQTQTLGYLGVANLSTALAGAAALLVSPIENKSEVWLVEHQVNTRNSNNSQKTLANVYKITSANNE
ncbi:hypothetical protein KO495_13830 [Colwellia sp. D2M02]|uniref:hypothetical protein n=1 Tax=Colwellia sp. D2M02 TaxID=2841562 RepID=UPI001C082133|nr:hypothetical protein [Colwellia sp. D2M02]MBU2894390.1 hypothetical protein [Colwellia sp. D2M02]